MNIEQILCLTAFLGAFTFVAMGLCIGNSIEAKESKKTADIMTIIGLIGLACFLVGFFGVVFYRIFLK
jgi:hypothetical protein